MSNYARVLDNVDGRNGEIKDNYCYLPRSCGFACKLNGVLFLYIASSKRCILMRIHAYVSGHDVMCAFAINLSPLCTKIYRRRNYFPSVVSCGEWYLLKRSESLFRARAHERERETCI